MNYIVSKPELKVVGTRPVRPDGVDKVTGRAQFGADMALPGMLWAKVVRSPHAHARIVKIDASRALALPGVKAVVTAGDFPDIPAEEAFVGEGPINFRDLSRNCLARDKVLYEGHAVAAVAAISQSIAEEAVGLVDVTYEVLPHVIDVEEAMRPDAPVLHDDLFTAGVEPKPVRPSNISKRVYFVKGDAETAFNGADVVVEGRYTTAPVHQAYIEPHACVVTVAADGQAVVYSSSQGQFMVRAYCAKLLGWEIANIRAVPLEIGGGFGGKTLVYLEPVALALSKKTGRPVKMQMTREEVFLASGPTSGSVIEVKIRARRDGTIIAAREVLKYQAGAFPGSPIQPGCMCGFAMYDIPNVEVIGYDVVSNRPKVAAYRAPGAPMSSFAVESALDDLGRRLGIDAITLREKNGARDGTKTHWGPTHRDIGFLETLWAAKESEHYRTPLKPGQGRGVACGFWFNIGGEFLGCRAYQRGRDGDGGFRQSGHWGIAGLHGDHGCRGAGHSGREGAAGGGGHGVNRVLAPDRGEQGDVRDWDGGDTGGGAGGGAAQSAGSGDLGDPRGGGRLAGRPGVSGRVERRRVRAAVARGDRAAVRQDWWADQLRGVAERAGRWAGLRVPYLRRGGRSRDRAGEDTPLHGGAGRGQGDPPKLRRGPDPGRCLAGGRLGVERGVHLRR